MLQARSEINWNEPWKLTRTRKKCERCGKSELHDEHRRMIIFIHECMGCVKHICRGCLFVHQDRGHAA